MIQFFGVEREHNPWAKAIAITFGPQSLVLYSLISALILFVFFALCFVTFSTMFKRRNETPLKPVSILDNSWIVRSFSLTIIYPFALLSISQGIVNLYYTYLANGWNLPSTIAAYYTMFVFLLSYPLWYGIYHSVLSISKETPIQDDIARKRIHKFGLAYVQSLIGIKVSKSDHLISRIHSSYVPSVLYLIIIVGGVVSIGVLTPFLELLPYGFKI